jgi:hypothetical protein
MFRRAKNEARVLSETLPYQPQYYVVSEYVKHSNINVSGSELANVYVLRKQKQRDQEKRRKDDDWPRKRNDIQEDVVLDQYQRVREHISNSWSLSVSDKGMARML